MTVRFVLAAVLLAAFGCGSRDCGIRVPARRGALERAIADARLRPATERRLLLADGVHELIETIELGPQDEGLVIAAAPGASPVVSAGRRVTDWRVDGKGWWHAQVPSSARFSQLYVNGTRRLRPYLPRQGYFVQDRKLGPDPKGRQCISYRKGEIDPDWKGLADAEICSFHTWTMSRLRPAAVDGAARVVTTTHPYFKAQDNFPFGHTTCYRVDNLKDALGEPGDWYLDRSGEVTYVPCAGERPETSEVVAVVLTNAVRLADATNVTFRGIAFAHVGWNLPAEGFHCSQAASRMGAAIEATRCRGVRLENCTVAHTGGWAVSFGDATEDCAVVRCHLADLGGGGVKIGNGQAGGCRDELVARGCVVEDCLIEDGGRVDPAGCGVWIGNGRDCRIAHNTIRRMYYTGVSSGWRWALGPNPTRGNVIEWNHIHDVGQHVLADMGGIYTLGVQPGTVERFNHIHDIDCKVDGNGIYFDSGSAFIVVSNNVVHDISNACWFMARISASNTVENNVFAYSRRNQICNPPWQEGSSPSTFRRNVVVWEDAALISAGATGKETKFEDNFAWCLDDPEAKLSAGFARVDPGCEDLKRRDFSFRTDSAAVARGFVPFSLDDAGCRGTPGSGFAVKPVPPVFGYVDRPDEPFADGFEESAVGTCPWGAYPKAATNLVTVTDRTAFSGRQSLEVVNSLSGWTPHFCRYLRLSKGRMRLSMALKVEPGAGFNIQMRDPDKWTVAVGPNVFFTPSGSLVVNGKGLAKFPNDVWFRTEIELGLGSARTDHTFVLRLFLPDEKEPREFAGLAFSPGFRKLDWIGFMSGCAGGKRYYVDDFKVDPVR